MRQLNGFSNPTRRLLRRTLAGSLVILAVTLITTTLVTSATSAADDVKLGSTIGIANVTAGDKDYAQAVNAKYNEVVKLQVYYNNAEDAASNKTAQKVRVKVDVPTGAGKAQSVKATVKGDNTNAIDEQVAVNLEDDSASLQYIPGSAVWKHNTGTNDATKFTEEKVSDEVVSGANGLVLEDQKPGDNYASTVTVLARVMVPGVKVTKQVEQASDSNKWADNNTAKPGDTLKYLIGYQNTGNTTQNKVIARDTLPEHMTIVPGTTTLTNTTNPSGVTVPSDDIASGGINIGSYAAGANAYISFQAKVDGADKLACGTNDLRATGGVQPENMNEYFGSAVTTVTRDCAAKPTPSPTPIPTPTPTPPQAVPTYSCDLLTVTKGDNRKVTAEVDYTAKDGATFKSVTYNFGDGSQALTTDKTTVDYTYEKDGDYNLTASLLLSVNGKDQTSTSAACAKSVSFAAPSTPTTPSTPAPTPNAKDGLPGTGPGDVVGIFAAATVIGTLAHRFLIRRFVR
jgi:uncharacterized repeat protein (TIGR01451 family)